MEEVEGAAIVCAMSSVEVAYAGRRLVKEHVVARHPLLGGVCEIGKQRKTHMIVLIAQEMKFQLLQ
jgi:hypothetical protein